MFESNATIIWAWTLSTFIHIYIEPYFELRLILNVKKLLNVYDNFKNIFINF